MSGWGLYLAVVVVLALVTVVLTKFDLGEVLRNAFHAVAATFLESRNPRPHFVERTYWTVEEYQRDSARLALLGYEITSKTETSQYLELASLRGRPSRGIRASTAHVIYEFQR